LDAGVVLQPPSTVCIVTEYCAGGDLEQWLYKDKSTGKRYAGQIDLYNDA